MKSKSLTCKVPKLRFPEFRDTPEWEEKTLKQYIKSHRGGAPLKPSDFVKESDYEVIPKKAIVPNGLLLLDQNEPIFCSKVFFENNQNSVVDETYLITTLRDLVPSGPNIGYIVNNPMKKLFILAQGVYGFKIKEKELDKSYLIQYSNRFEYRRLMQKMMVGSTQVHIRNNDFFNMPITLASIKEQQKIADCLSSLDNLITAQSKKVEALKTHKKGLMQQLFPQEGETKPKLRFPEFKDAPEWEEKRLGNICDITNGKANAQDHIEDGIYPLFDRSAVIKQTNNYLFDCEAVIIPGEGMRFIPKYYNGKFDLHQRAYALQNFKCDAKFIYYLMDLLKEVLATKAVQSTVLSLRLPILENFIILMPYDKGIKEQQKIADCLSAADELIASATKKLQTLKEHKKGLMQQLFPTGEN